MCVFKNSAASRGESVGKDATQMNSGIKWQQHNHSSGSHVSWRASKETRASLSASTRTLNCLHQLLRWTWRMFFATTNAIFMYYRFAFFPHHISQMVRPTNNRSKEEAISQSCREITDPAALIIYITSDKV